MMRAQIFPESGSGAAWRGLVAVLLSFVLGSDLWAQANPAASPRTQIEALPLGSKIDVRLSAGGKLSGLLLSRDQSGFTMTVGRGRSQTKRLIAFGETESVIAHPRTHTPVAAWILAGALVAIVVIVIAAVEIERNN